jgi:hypothetical protein
VYAGGVLPVPAIWTDAVVRVAPTVAGYSQDSKLFLNLPIHKAFAPETARLFVMPVPA